MSAKRLLADLRDGNSLEAFEAAKALLSLPGVPFKAIIAVLDKAAFAHNRQAAAYALSLICGRNNEPLKALLNAFDKAEEDPVVRGQALEGLGMRRLTRRHHLWNKIEAAIKEGLMDESAEVRFWACYAAGSLKMRAVLPQLQELASTDTAICPNFWQVSEEASDAIEWIHGRATPTRTPASSQILNL